MQIDFSKKIYGQELGLRIRAIMGVPEEILDNDIISSPTFRISAEKYINKQIDKYEETELMNYLELINIAYLYHICYYLCSGMYARLPKQMENKNTKTIMQSIDWDSRAIEMLDKCNNILEDIISEIDDEVEYGSSFAVLTNASEYPNTSI